MGKHILIPGSGTVGSMTVNRLQRGYDERHFRITVVVDEDDGHGYPAGLLLALFGPARPTTSSAPARDS